MIKGVGGWSKIVYTHSSEGAIFRADAVDLFFAPSGVPGVEASETTASPSPLKHSRRARLPGQSQEASNLFVPQQLAKCSLKKKIAMGHPHEPTIPPRRASSFFPEGRQLCMTLQETPLRGVN